MIKFWLFCFFLLAVGFETLASKKVNIRLLARVLGLLLVLQSFALGACTAFAAIDRVGSTSVTVALGISTSVAFMVGSVMAFLGRGQYDRIPRREGVLIVGLGWLCSGLVGALPFALAEPHLSLAAAFFEAISGLTTTGSTVIADLDEWPRPILLWRSLSQWLGGLGILVLFVALLSSLGTGTKSLFRNESSFEAAESSNAKIRDTAKLLWVIYVVLTLLCFAGLKGLGMTWFDAGCHAMTCLSTGGFSTHNESIGFFSQWRTGLAIELWLSLFMIIGSVSFLVYAVILRRNWDRLRSEEEARYYLGFILIATAVVTLLQVFATSAGGEASWGFWESLRAAFFTVVSVGSSTGYGTVDFDAWPVAAHFLLLIVMIIGGCAGSTAGGMKVGRLLVLLRTIHHEVVQAFRPNQVMRTKVNGHSISQSSQSQTIIFVALYFTVALISMLVVSLLEGGKGIDFETTVSLVFTVLSNIGPGFSQVGPTQNFSEFGESTLIYLSFLMIMGRLELFAFLVLIFPSAWKRY